MLAAVFLLGGIFGGRHHHSYATVPAVAPVPRQVQPGHRLPIRPLQPLLASRVVMPSRHFK